MEYQALFILNKIRSSLYAHTNNVIFWN